MTDIKETPQPPEPPSEAKEFQMTDKGRSAMQGQMDAGAPTAPKSVPDNAFVDNQGRNIQIRTYPSGDSAYIRAYDRQQTPTLPETPHTSDVGQANLHFEKDADGNVERARLQDILISNPQYRGSGIGNKMLESSEAYASKSSAKEIYGDFSPETGKETQIRQWYAKHGYGFRPGRSGGEEIYKPLS